MSKELISKRASEILTEVKDFISEKGLERMNTPGIESNDLPEFGVFNTYVTSGKVVTDADGKEQDFRHLRMSVKDSDLTTSISNIVIVAPLAASEVEFGKINKKGALEGKAYLKGKSVNPHLAKYSQAELIAFLEGKHFKAERVQVKNLPYNAAGYDFPNNVNDIKALTKTLVVKDAFVITMLTAEQYAELKK